MNILSMRRVLLLALAAAATRAQARPIALGEAYAAALKRSEEVAEKGETYAQALAQIDEFWAAVKPHLSLNATQLWQAPAPSAFAAFEPTSQQTVALNVTQPLFSGFREFLAVRQSQAQGESAELQFERAKQLLYQDVASAYLNLLQSRQDIAAREETVKLTSDRVKELQNFESIGRSRTSEVLAARAQLAQNEADVETSRGLDRIYLETLQFLTGLSDELEPGDLTLPQAEDEAPFLERARRRPDVESARRDLEASELFVSIQSRQRWPTIGFSGNYYLARSNPSYQNINWDATVTGQLPLYWGGQISAQTREAEARRRYNEQALSLALRQAELDVRSAHSDLVSDLAIVKALENAKTLAEENAKAQAADYRHGLVTNIDVLASLTTVQDTRLRLDQARAAAVLARARLDVAAGDAGSAR